MNRNMGDKGEWPSAHQLQPEKRELTITGKLCESEVPDGQTEIVEERLRHFLHGLAHPAVIETMTVRYEDSLVNVQAQVTGTESELHDLAAQLRGELASSENGSSESGSITTNLSVPVEMQAAQRTGLKAQEAKAAADRVRWASRAI